MSITNNEINSNINSIINPNIFIDLEEVTDKFNDKIIKKQKKIRQELEKFCKRGELIICDDLAYQLYTKSFNKSDNSSIFFNYPELTFFISYSSQIEILQNDDKIFKPTEVNITGLNKKDNSRNMKLIISGYGLAENFGENMFDKTNIAKFIVLKDDVFDLVRKTSFVYYNYYLISLEYILIKWFHHLSEPREINSLEKWEDYYYKTKELENMYLKKLVSDKKLMKRKENDKSVKDVKNIFQKIIKYAKENNDKILLTGECAISFYLNMDLDYEWRNIKILHIKGNINDTKNDILSLVKKYDFKYNLYPMFLKNYHGPVTIFESEKIKNFKIELYQSSEQCIPYINYNGINLARIPNILKYLLFEPIKPRRNFLIKEILKKRDEYYKENNISSLEPSIFQMYDVECIGNYISRERKKRINEFKRKLKNKE